MINAGVCAGAPSAEPNTIFHNMITNYTYRLRLAASPHQGGIFALNYDQRVGTRPQLCILLSSMCWSTQTSDS